MDVPTQTITRRRFISQAGGVALAAALAPAAAASTLRALSAEGPILGWQPLSDGVWGLQNLSYGGNTLIVAGKEAVMLVDTSFPALAGSLVDDASTLSEGAPLTLVNTHHHGDHTGGNAVVIPSSARSYAHTNALPRIRAQVARYRQMAQGAPNQLRSMGISDKRALELAIDAADAGAEIDEARVTPSHTIDAHERLDVGGVRVELHHFGAGHTDNDVVVHIPDRNVVHTGDLLFNGLHPFFDIDAGVDPEGWISSLTKIHDLCDADTVVVSGHGPITDRAALKTQIAYHEALIEHVQDAIDTGKSKEETQAMTWGFMEGMGFENLRPRAIGAVYGILNG